MQLTLQFQNHIPTMTERLQFNFTSVEEEINSLQYNIDDLSHITMGCFVFFMQPGFAFLEAGSVRYC